jgi:hypothetical protein
VLSTEDIERLSALLVPHSAPRLQDYPAPESKQLNLEREERIRRWQAWRRKVANMAIDHWNRTIGVSLCIQLFTSAYALLFLDHCANRHCYVPNLFLQGT